ncbi:8161_t:CDS:1, partial [Gigaspora rosea]
TSRIVPQDSSSSNSIKSSKGPHGSKFDATKTSSESGSHSKSDQAGVESKNRHGQSSASKRGKERKEDLIR